LLQEIDKFLNSQQQTIVLLLLITMLTATNHTLDKLETLLNCAGYKVRYEKGNFKTGACLLQSSRMIVVNKFSNLESKIQSLSELVRQLDIDVKALDDKQLAFLQTIKQTELQL
jgi:hypothetical protein